MRRNATDYEIEDKKFANQLNYYLDNCPDVQKKLESVGYSTGSIIRLLSKYSQQCGSKQIGYSNENASKGITEIYILAGAASNYLHITNDPGTLGGNILGTVKPLQSSPSLALGLRLNYIWKKI